MDVECPNCGRVMTWRRGQAGVMVRCACGAMWRLPDREGGAVIIAEQGEEAKLRPCPRCLTINPAAAATCPH